MCFSTTCEPHWRRRSIDRAVLAACAFALLWNATAVAQGGGKGGGGVPTGVIYFDYYFPQPQGELHFGYMNADGSNKTYLPGVSGEPSFALHGGDRWFLKAQDDGSGVQQLFAQNDDGALVQLTFDAADKSNGDTARRWTRLGAAVDGAVSWQQSDGIYRAPVVYDSGGDVAGIGTAVNVVPASDVASHHWSPSGQSLVYAISQPGSVRMIYVVDDVSNPGATTRLLSSFGHDPEWSPDGTKIVFDHADIYTINPSGSGLKAIIKESGWINVYEPKWSPTGSHLAYGRNDQSASPPYDYDVFRATGSGGSKTDLTADIEGITYPRAWREGPGAGP